MDKDNPRQTLAPILFFGFQNLLFFFHFFLQFFSSDFENSTVFSTVFFLSLFSVENFKSKSERFYRKSVEKKSMHVKMVI